MVETWAILGKWSENPEVIFSAKLFNLVFQSFAWSSNPLNALISLYAKIANMGSSSFRLFSAGNLLSSDNFIKWISVSWKSVALFLAIKIFL